MQRGVTGKHGYVLRGHEDWKTTFCANERIRLNNKVLLWCMYHMLASHCVHPMHYIHVSKTHSTFKRLHQHPQALKLLLTQIPDSFHLSDPHKLSLHLCFLQSPLPKPDWVMSKRQSDCLRDPCPLKVSTVIPPHLRKGKPRRSPGTYSTQTPATPPHHHHHHLYYKWLEKRNVWDG